MKYIIFGEYINQHLKNLELRNKKLEVINIRTTNFQYEIGDFVEVDVVNGKATIGSCVARPDDYLDYFNKGKLTNEELVLQLSNYVEKINNDRYKIILQELIFKCDDYFVFPAAKSIHHAYIGGLCEHTLNILKLADACIDLYDLNQDLLYTGIMLHDYGKVRELKDYGLTYSIEGNLLGHITMCVEEIANIAINLEFNDHPDVYALKHLILSHHGRMDFGSPKEPMLKEAYVLSMLDELDAKMNVLEKALLPLEKGKLSPPQMGFDRRRFVKL